MQKKQPPTITIDLMPKLSDYSLLDSGDGMKLERYGQYALIRPEPEAFWHPALPSQEWENAHAAYISPSGEQGGRWDFKHKIPTRWQIRVGEIRCWVELSTSRHIGIFPEQLPQWQWVTKKTLDARRTIKVLNLFGYTGLASLAAAQAGATITHVDASKRAVQWAKRNQAISGLADKPIRWIVDDALKFAQRERRRGSSYEGIILDPPKFGRGPQGEVWEFYKYLPNLLQACEAIMSKDAVFLVLTAYAVKASALTLHEALQGLMQPRGGKISVGELVQQDESGGRLLSRAIYARWENTSGRREQ